MTLAMTKNRITVTEVAVATEPATKVFQIRIESDGASWDDVANSKDQLSYMLHGMRVALAMCAGCVGTASMDAVLEFTPESMVKDWLEVP